MSPLPLELGGIEDPDTRRAFEQIAQRFPLHAADLANDVLLLNIPGTARKVALGTGTWTWPGASTTSNIATVTHSLTNAAGQPATPLGVWIEPNQDQGAAEMLATEAFTYTTTTFATRARFFAFAPAVNTQLTFVWLVIG